MTHSKEKYIAAWEAHVQELLKLFVETADAAGASNPYTVACDRVHDLKEEIRRTADALYAEDEAA